MAKEPKAIKLGQVSYCYTGTDEQFNEFLKAVVRDYIVDDKLMPDEEDNK